MNDHFFGTRLDTRRKAFRNRWPRKLHVRKCDKNLGTDLRREYGSHLLQRLIGFRAPTPVIDQQNANGCRHKIPKRFLNSIPQFDSSIRFLNSIPQFDS